MYSNYSAAGTENGRSGVGFDSEACLQGDDVEGTWHARNRVARNRLHTKPFPVVCSLFPATDLATTSGDSWALNHLPKIVHVEEKEFDADSPQCRLSAHLGEDYELRVLRIVVQERLRPITELATAAELSEAFHGIFKCYQWLFEKANIMHRDISRNNLMYRRIDGTVYGIWNGFDLSVVLGNEPRSTSKQRTGTEPYMAIDLLETDPPPPMFFDSISNRSFTSLSTS
ncbi:hypothetical protein DFH08DRAFT_978613 [Mycena albidolilacea]|uniref:Fungal-type protein kinase domain-containing protein n=1 Tax=Mycena albidolilacea TaxID=1033008 RepID=A0AAD6YZ00_9AGAR|nr:hypothetical protein DFH08DRAFT_978613 [Mycena albidolilacea]